MKASLMPGPRAGTSDRSGRSVRGVSLPRPGGMAASRRLEIAPEGDPLEREADRVAELVMRMPAPDLSITPAGFRLNRACASCAAEQDETLPLWRAAADGGRAPRAAPPVVGEAIRTAGEPLGAAVRAFMESRFNRDFADVRIHRGATAEQSARTVNARAYTVGRDVVFASGQYAPGTTQGRLLLAHELAHVAQNRAALLSRQPAPPCASTFAPAKSFKALIDLVRAAEAKLAAAGVTSVDAQIKSLRSIYYGQTYSLDYKVEASKVRNLGFETYTHSLTSGPKDPTSILDCGLFAALQNSQDVSDGARTLDFGHLLIALDARESVLDRIPFPSGGTGTEVVTWLGDLGGGAGSLAVARATAPTANVSSRFTGTDYGAASNLEGDVAGFLVGTASGATSVTAPSIAAGNHVSDALQDYLSPGVPGTAWKTRARNFLTLYGGTFDPSGALTNAADLTTRFAGKIQTFACQYLISRAADGRITPSQLQAATDNVIPCAEEMAETFVATLSDCAVKGGSLKATRFPSPKPAKPGACKAITVASSAVKAAENLEKKAKSWWKGVHIPNPF